MELGPVLTTRIESIQVTHLGPNTSDATCDVLHAHNVNLCHLVFVILIC